MWGRHVNSDDPTLELPAGFTQFLKLLSISTSPPIAGVIAAGVVRVSESCRVVIANLIANPGSGAKPPRKAMTISTRTHSDDETTSMNL